MPENAYTATEIVRLEPGPDDTHELYIAILAERCPDCGADAGAHCIRPSGAIRYETRLAHESRITAAAKRANDVRP